MTSRLRYPAALGRLMFVKRGEENCFLFRRA